jgi:hypothetical protein
MSEVTMTLEQMQAEIERLKAVNASLTSKPSHGLKIGEKGAVSKYGLQRFPITLYGSAWCRLLLDANTIVQFLVENKDKLTIKDGKGEEFDALLSQVCEKYGITRS